MLAKRARVRLALFGLAAIAAAALRPAHAATGPISATDWGAVCDGASHPIGSTPPYDQLTSDQLHLLFSTYAAPTDELDALAINQALSVALQVTLPATPGNAACVLNQTIALGSHAWLTGQGQTQTVLRFEVAAGHGVPDYPQIVIGGNTMAEVASPTINVNLSGFTLDGDWPADGNHLGSPSPKTGFPGPIGVFLGASAQQAKISNLEIRNEYGSAIQVTGSYNLVSGNFLHDNWGPTIHVSGLVNFVGVPVYAAHNQILQNTLSHNSLQNYPAQNANGGYGGLPSLMTGTGPYFVLHPAGPDSNCPQAPKCLGGNDGITFDPLSQNNLAAENTLYGSDLLVFSYGYIRNGKVYPDTVGGDVLHDNTVIASASNGASVDGWPAYVTITGNTFQNMISTLSANVSPPPSLAQQLAYSDGNACLVMSGPAKYLTVTNNVCTGGSITPDYSVFPPSFTSPRAVATPGIAAGALAYAAPLPVNGGGQAMMAPSNVILSANQMQNATKPGHGYAIIGFMGQGSVVPDYFTINQNILSETRGLPQPPFPYSLDMSHAGVNMSAQTNTPLPGFKGVANILPGQTYVPGKM